MNILIIESDIPPYIGGIQRVSWILRNYFISQGHDVFFAFYLCDFPEVDESHKLRYKQGAKEKELREQLLPFVIKNKINIIINQGLTNKPLVNTLNIIRKKSVAKVIGCFHVSPDFSDYQEIPLKIKIKKLIRNVLFLNSVNQFRLFYDTVDKFVLLSATFIDEMCRRYRFPDQKKICCIPNPLSFDSTFEDVASKEKLVMIITRLEDTQKNIKSALRIWKQVEMSGKCADWKLVLGGYGPDEDVLLTYAKSMNFTNFEFIGKVDNAQELYQKASIFMMTSRYEGFGMTLTESLQNACVPFAFDNFTVLHDILQDGYNGAVIPSNDEDAYAKRLVDIMQNDELRKQMAHNAVKSSSKFSIEVVGQQWINLFNSLL